MFFIELKAIRINILVFDSIFDRYHSAPVSSMYNLDHLLSSKGCANIHASKMLNADDDDDHITDFIEDKFRAANSSIFNDDTDDIEIESPLDLSLRK